MLCGAKDTKDIREVFTDVVRRIGGEPWHYMNGSILRINNANASWAMNSQMSVRKAAMCVFVIVREYGTLTWTIELEEAFLAGKPFAVLCLQETYEEYLTLRDKVADRQAIVDPDSRALLTLLDELESDDRQLSVTPFTFSTFDQVLTREVAAVFQMALKVVEDRNLRMSTVRALNPLRHPSRRQIELLRDLALDETEDKNVRKQAISVIADDGGFDLEDTTALLHSAEQGVQRLAAARLTDLYQMRPVEPQLIDDLIELTSASEDVGIARRLLTSLLQLDLRSGLVALGRAELTEVGARRRLAAELERSEIAIIEAGLHREALELAARCLEPNSAWADRCRALMMRLEKPSAVD